MRSVISSPVKPCGITGSPDLADDDGVPGARLLQQLAQFRPVGARAAGRLRPDRRAPGGLEGIQLQGVVLRVCRDARIGNDHGVLPDTHPSVPNSEGFNQDRLLRLFVSKYFR